MKNVSVRDITLIYKVACSEDSQKAVSSSFNGESCHEMVLINERFPSNILYVKVYSIT